MLGLPKSGFIAISAAFLSTFAWPAAPVVEKVAAPSSLTPLQMLVGGRVLTTQSSTGSGFGSQYEYQWPGTYFEARFEGSEVYFQIGKGHEILHVVLDNDPPVVLTDPDPGVYRLSGFNDGPHTVRLSVVTESQSGPNYFGGFAVVIGEKPAGEKPLASKRARRQVEFIGDSHTVGYGNTSAKRECTQDQVWSTTDNSQAFGPLVAGYYHADYQINAISGRGIVRNYNGFPADTLPAAYPYVLFDKKEDYSDGTWKPQLIVISLGTNDFSTPLNPGEKWKTRDELQSDYEATYIRFVHALRVRNPNAYIILWATDMANGEIGSEVERVVEQLKKDGDRNVAFVPVEHLSFTGCDYHPSTADDNLIRDALVRVIDAKPEIWQGH